MPCLLPDASQTRPSSGGTIFAVGVKPFFCNCSRKNRAKNAKKQCLLETSSEICRTESATLEFASASSSEASGTIRPRTGLLASWTTFYGTGTVDLQDPPLWCCTKVRLSFVCDAHAIPRRASPAGEAAHVSLQLFWSTCSDLRNDRNSFCKKEPSLPKSNGNCSAVATISHCALSVPGGDQ